METALRYAEQHSEKMAIVTTTADARKVIASGRMAVFLGNELGWDHEGDLDVLGAFYRLGLRTVQFASQTGFNAMADSDISHAAGRPEARSFPRPQRAWPGGRSGDEPARHPDRHHPRHRRHPETAHRGEQGAGGLRATTTIKAASGAGMSDEVLKLLASKGGVVGIHGGAAVVGKRYRKWVAEHPDEMKEAAKGLRNMLGYEPSQPRKAGDHGEYIAMFDKEFGGTWRERGSWKERPCSSR